MSSVVLLFSGGRDSTAAALRLFHGGSIPHLVTVTSDHLEGIQRVKARLKELRPLLSPDVRYSIVAAPTDIPVDSEGGCLPCHTSYAVVGAELARRNSVESIAFGYVSYQSGWLEQTPGAIVLLGQQLESTGLRLLTPVYDIVSKEDVVSELQRHGLDGNALEQKCLRQQINPSLPAHQVLKNLQAWERSIAKALTRKLTVAASDEGTLGTL